jgi:hypothetical protein
MTPTHIPPYVYIVKDVPNSSPTGFRVQGFFACGGIALFIFLEIVDAEIRQKGTFFKGLTLLYV